MKKALIALLIATAPFAGFTRTKDVVAQGTSGTCWRRTTSMEMALIATKTDAREECKWLGSGWFHAGVKFEGEENCERCKSSNEYFCTIKKAIHVCENKRD